MNNYINSRVEVREEKKSINHNIRSANIVTTDNQQKDKVEDNSIQNYVYMNGKATILTSTLAEQIKSKQLDIYDNLFEEFKVRYEERRGRKLTKDRHLKALVQDNVLTFSEAIKTDLGSKYSIEEFMQIAQDTINDYCKEYKCEMIENSLVLHSEEETYHLHYQLKNFDKQGQNLYYQMKMKGLSKLQDIAANNFGKLGIERGQAKEVSNATNTPTWKWKQQEVARLEKKIKEQKAEILNLKEINHKQQVNHKILMKLNDMLINIKEVELNTIKQLKEQYKGVKPIIQVLNNIQRAKNHIINDSEYSKVEKSLSSARGKLKKLNDVVLNQDINVNAMITKKEALKFKEEKKQGKWVEVEKYNKDVEAARTLSLSQKEEFKTKIKVGEAGTRIEKKKVEKLKKENKEIKSNSNDLVDELEEAEEFINNKGLSADFVEFKQSTIKTSELFDNDKKNNISHSLKR